MPRLHQETLQIQAQIEQVGSGPKCVLLPPRKRFPSQPGLWKKPPLCQNGRADKEQRQNHACLASPRAASVGKPMVSCRPCSGGRLSRAELAALGGSRPVVLDHITPEATSFAAAWWPLSVIGRFPAGDCGSFCPDVRIQDRSTLSSVVWQCPALYFPGKFRRLVWRPWRIRKRWRNVYPSSAAGGRLARMSRPFSLVRTASVSPRRAQRDESQRRTLEIGAKLDAEAFLEELARPVMSAYPW